MFLIGSGKVYNFGLYAAYQVFTGTCQFNKLTSVFYASVLLLMINCHNIVKVAVEPRAHASPGFQILSICPLIDDKNQSISA